MDHLIAELTKRNMKLMMDLVVNHTSEEVFPSPQISFIPYADNSQHAWFLESRSSLTNPKRDWYIWKPPRRAADGSPQPPNNWSQLLGEANSAWTYDKHTDQYYLSLFSPEQPDLNWENPDVRAAVHDIMHFWLARGVRGYRMDVINMISKVQSFPDAEPVLGPGHKYHPGSKYYVNGPRMHEYLQEMNHKVLSKYDTITVGEMRVADMDEIFRTVGSKAGELNMIFIFDIVDIDEEPGDIRLTLREWDVKDLRYIINKWQRAMRERDGWNSVFLENHDNPRSVSRYTDDSDTYRTYGAKLLALMQLSLAGTLYIYQGEELGMRNVPRSWDPDKDYKDIEGRNFWKKSKALYGNDPQKLAEARHILASKARDNARTPMQWTAGPSAGFCAEGVEPWMRVNDDYKEVNAERQLAEKGDGEEEMSVYHFWQSGLKYRKANMDIFVYGAFEIVGSDTDEEVFAYMQRAESGEARVVVLNFTGKEVLWEIPPEVGIEEWVTGNYTRAKEEKGLEGKITLRPWEGLLGKVASR